MTIIRTKAVILDLDGTLVDSAEAYLEAANTALAAINLPPTSLFKALEIGKCLELGFTLDKIVSFFTLNTTQKTIKKFREAYAKAYHNASIDKIKLIPGAKATLEKVAKTFPLGIVTRRFTTNKIVWEQLSLLEIAPYFRAVITRFDVKHPKPAPDSIVKCAAELNVQTNACTVVGDSVADIRAGKSANSKTIAVLTGLFWENELKLEEPDLIIKDITELPNHLERR